MKELILRMVVEYPQKSQHVTPAWQYVKETLGLFLKLSDNIAMCTT